MRYRFPNGKEIAITEPNIFLSDYSKEEIIEKKLYSLIPFYIARYENELKSEKGYENALKDLAYFRDMMVKLLTSNELSPAEYTDLHGASVRIASHITDGNEIEKEVMDTMGGEIYETEWEQFEREVVNPLKQQIADKDEVIADMEDQLASYASENAQLKQQLAELQS